MKSTGSTARAGRLTGTGRAGRLTGTGRAGRLTGAVVIAVTLAGSLLAAAPSAGAAVLASDTCPVVWNGADLVTAAISANDQLYAYEQVPGGSSWTKQLVAKTAPDNQTLVSVSMAATTDTVQIVAADSIGDIWYFSQIDDEPGWSTGQLVGSVSTGNPYGVENPQIAWTGVPGHAGTNSVITVADGAGDILYWYQNSSGGWTEQTIATGSSSNEYYDPAITATDKGIVIVAPGSNGAFYSFFQAYSTRPWDSDGTIGVGSGQSFHSVAVTWDGTNVDVTATYANGQQFDNYANELLFLWKSDSASFWSDETVLGPVYAVDFTPAITYTGSNLLLTAVQATSTNTLRLDFWWQGSTFTQFNFESAGKSTGPDDIFTPQIAYTEGASAREAAIVAPFYSGSHQATGVDDWTEPYGSSTWTRHVVIPA